MRELTGIDIGFAMNDTIETRGLERLRRWLEADASRSQTTLATLLGLKQPSISAWLRGHSRPEALQRQLLELHCGIPSDDWYTDDERTSLRRARRRVARTGTGTGAEG